MACSCRASVDGMHRRRFLASVLGLAAACSSRNRRAPFSKATHAIGLDPGKPGADNAVLVEVPPRHAMSMRIKVLADDPDRWVAQALEGGRWRDITDETTAKIRALFPDEIAALRDS